MQPHYTILENLRYQHDFLCVNQVLQWSEILVATKRRYGGVVGDFCRRRFEHRHVRVLGPSMASLLLDWLVIYGRMIVYWIVSVKV